MTKEGFFPLTERIIIELFFFFLGFPFYLLLINCLFPCHSVISHKISDPWFLGLVYPNWRSRRWMTDIKTPFNKVHKHGVKWVENHGWSFPTRIQLYSYINFSNLVTDHIVRQSCIILILSYLCSRPKILFKKIQIFTFSYTSWWPI